MLRVHEQSAFAPFTVIGSTQKVGYGGLLKNSYERFLRENANFQEEVAKRGAEEKTTALKT